MQVEQNACLRSYNTLRIAARARYLVHLHTLDDVRAFAASWNWRGLPRLILGSGSNVLLSGDFDGVVARVALRGIDVTARRAQFTEWRAAAGEDWHGFVQRTIASGDAGLENLSLIPGSVGAAPVQNIGAYGVELSNVLHNVEAVDLDANEHRVLSSGECDFGYRDSRFKRPGEERWLITAVSVRLPRPAAYVTDYRGVREELQRLHVARPDAASISRAICNIRRRKLPDPAELGNAGSFFKNPQLDAARFLALRQREPDVPGYVQADGHYKVPAAWLIEQCGWKGFRDGDAGVYEQHALVLVNHGGASSAALTGLAERIRADVLRRFGVQLEIEPRVV